MAEAKVMPKVLLIDDESEILDMIRWKLENDGYRVLTASDGQTGLTMAQAEHPDVILLDVRLPLMDGHQVLRMLKDGLSTKDIPVVMLTVSGGEHEISRSIELGAVCHMEKPHQIDRLLEEVRIECQRHRLSHVA